jgi:hypothetical protein
VRRILALAAASALAAGGLLLGATPAAAAVCGPPALPDPTTTIIEDAPNATVFFPIPGLCLAPGGTILSSNPQGATVTTLADGSGSAGITVVPANADPQVIPVTVTVDQGDSTTRSYYVAAYLGVSPTIVWPPAAVPTQVAIEQGGDGSFTLPGL